MPRTVHLRILVTEKEAKAIKAIASKAGLSVSTYGRNVMLSLTEKGLTK